MSSRNDYRLEDFSTSAEHRPISSRSRNSQAPSEEESAQNPFVDQSDNLGNSHPSQPYDPGSGNNLLSGEIEQPYAHDQTFLREWKLELTAWLVAAVSVVSLILVFAFYRNKSLRQWKADITPATTVAIISQIGQTCVLAPVTACICQSMWLWLDQESRATHRATANSRRTRQIMMQRYYDGGSRGPMSSLFLLWKRPDAYASTLLLFF